MIYLDVIAIYQQCSLKAQAVRSLKHRKAEESYLHIGSSSWWEFVLDSIRSYFCWKLMGNNARVKLHSSNSDLQSQLRYCRSHICPSFEHPFIQNILHQIAWFLIGINILANINYLECNEQSFLALSILRTQYNSFNVYSQI